MDVVHETDDRQGSLSEWLDAMRRLNAINEPLVRSIVALHRDCGSGGGECDSDLDEPVPMADRRAGAVRPRLSSRRTTASSTEPRPPRTIEGRPESYRCERVQGVCWENATWRTTHECRWPLGCCSCWWVEPGSLGSGPAAGSSNLRTVLCLGLRTQYGRPKREGDAYERTRHHHHWSNRLCGSHVRLSRRTLFRRARLSSPTISQVARVAACTRHTAASRTHIRSAEESALIGSRSAIVRAITEARLVRP